MNPFVGKTIAPRNDFILIQKAHKEETEGGLALPEGAQVLPSFLGTILAVGPGLMQYMDSPADLSDYRQMVFEGLQKKHHGHPKRAGEDLAKMGTSERNGWYTGCPGLWVGQAVIFFHHQQVFDGMDIGGGLFLVRENNVFAVLLDSDVAKGPQGIVEGENS